MKKYIFLLSLLATIGCVGDYEYVRFEAPQPEGVKNSNSFSKSIIGEYIHCSDSNQRLPIHQNRIMRHNKYGLKVHRDELELDSAVQIDKQNDEELKKLFENEGFSVEIFNDTIKATYKNTNVLFEISENELLRNFRKNY
jgi:hypothetical protein